MVLGYSITPTPKSCWLRTWFTVMNKDLSSLRSPLAPNIPLVGASRKGLMEVERQGLRHREGIRGHRHRCLEALLLPAPNSRGQGKSPHITDLAQCL